MELFDLAVRLCSRRRAIVVLVGCFVLILAAWLSNEIDTVFDSVLYTIACFAVIVAIVSWLLGARSEQKAINELMAFGFSADGAVAEKWAALVAEARPHFYLFRSWRDERAYHKVCKLFYVNLWICLGAYCLFSLPSLNLPPAPTFLFAALCAIATGLCCASYYFCCVCIWFIGEVSKMECLEKQPAGGLCPDLSPLVFDMRRLASRNTAVFLFVSLLLSISILVCVIIRKDMASDKSFIFLFLSILAVGYVTFGVLFACSKIFIDRLVVRWRRSYLLEIERVIAESGVGCGLAYGRMIGMFDDCAKSLGVSCRVSSIDAAMIFLATITLVVNAVSMVLGFRSL